MFTKGDVLRVNRVFYYHYGVYVGNGRVVHFSAPKGENEINPFMADICEVSLEEFAKDAIPEVDTNFKPAFDPETIVKRARRMIGTQMGRYNLAGNNCEHFANWCKTGQTVSHQSNEVGEMMKPLSQAAGKLLESFVGVRSEIGQQCYDDIWKGKEVKPSIVSLMTAKEVSKRPVGQTAVKGIEVGKKYCR